MALQFGPDDLRNLVADFPDFPQAGVLFRDISPILTTPGALSSAIDLMSKPFMEHSISKVVGIEARGFLLGPQIADRLGAGFCPARKTGKLPGQVVTATYDLEYGGDSIEIQTDCLDKHDKVLVVDDVLASGGTLAAAEQLVSKIGARTVGASVLIELQSLNGRKQLGVRDVAAVIHY